MMSSTITSYAFSVAAHSPSVAVVHDVDGEALADQAASRIVSARADLVLDDQHAHRACPFPPLVPGGPGRAPSPSIIASEGAGHAGYPDSEVLPPEQATESRSDTSRW